MASRRMNDRLRVAEENLPTHGTRMLSENTRKSFRRVHFIVQLASWGIAVSLDPLFLYIPVINDHEKCFHFDNKLRIAALVLRSITDIIFMLHVAFQFRTGYVAKPILPHMEGVNETVVSLIRTWKTLQAHMLSYFLIDILSLLPLPQVVILSIIPKMKGAKSLMARDILTALVLLQYVPRVVRIYPLYKKLTWTPMISTGTLWIKAAQNLFLYMLASHVLGALWYFFSIEREITCWQEACEGQVHPRCDHSSFFCDDGTRAADFLHDMCPVDPPNTKLFDFGIFLDALRSGIVESVNLHQKLFRCLWWGLQNMSSYGQSLETSSYVWENIFAIFVSTSGLVLVLFFIGNMQTYLQSKTVEKERKRMETISSMRLAVDLWTSNNKLPEPIERRIKHAVENKWDEIKIVNSENLIPILPVDLQKDTIRYLCSDLFKKVPVLASMNDQLLDDMYYLLKPVLYSKDSYIIKKGDSVGEMCIILRGKVSSDADVGRTELQTGDFCGEELLTWAFNGGPSRTHLPTSNQTARALTDVEAFLLTSGDLQFLLTELWGKDYVKFCRIARCYSAEWRTWAARVIQMAWRRHARRKLKRKLKESLRKKEIIFQDPLAEIRGKETEIITALRLRKPADLIF